MTRRLIVDAAALGRLVEAAHLARDPAVAAALADLIEAGTGRDQPPWLTVPEAARALQVSERTIRRQVARGALPHRRIGTSLRIARTAVFGPHPTTTDHSGQPVGQDATTEARSPQHQGARP